MLELFDVIFDIHMLTRVHDQSHEVTIIKLFLSHIASCIVTNMCDHAAAAVPESPFFVLPCCPWENDQKISVDFQA
jgi:hypothetical protein